MDNVNLPLGLRVQTQIPLDVKTYSPDEATLSNLGVNNNLAFTYTQGLIVYCIEEGTRWEWREAGLLETGLRPTNFTYPPNVITFGIDYSNREFNFFSTKETILETSPFEYKDEGNGTGVVIRDRDPLNYGPIGFSAFDNSKSFTASTERGATAWFSAIVNGQNHIISPNAEASFIGAGFRNSITNGMDSAIVAGSNNTISGDGGGRYYFIGAGVGNTISDLSFIGSNAIITGNANEVHSFYGLVGNGSFNVVESTAQFGTILNGDTNHVTNQKALILQGYQNIASGANSTVINGANSNAKGDFSTVINGWQDADSYSEVVCGLFGTTYTPASRTTFNAADRAFNVGVGSTENFRADGLSVFKSGVVTLPTITNALISAGSGKTLITKEYLESVVPPTETNLQKVINTNYTVTNADNNYVIFVDNAVPITITIDTTITTPNFCVGFVQKSADINTVTFSAVGVTLQNPIGFKMKGQFYQCFIERELNTSTYYLLGNVKL